jgi:SAM-dependent methyltransferase
MAGRVSPSKGDSVKDRFLARLPRKTYNLLFRLRHPAWFKLFIHQNPLSKNFGSERGTPLDRYYIENFLEQNRNDIHGHVLEVSNNIYTKRFGQNVDRSEILDNNRDNPNVTLIADLEAAEDLPSNQFDCLIFTQVLQFIYRVEPCVAHLYRALKEGGVLLATLPSNSRIAPDYGIEKDYWRFHPGTCEKLFGSIFGQENITIQGYGNNFVDISFLQGIAYEEISKKQLDYYDPLFPLLVTVRAVKCT